MSAVAERNADALHPDADHNRLVRELDVLLNGHRAAPQASLCDIVGQLAQVRRGIYRPILDELVALQDRRW